jgi:hypothetical protein
MKNKELVKYLFADACKLLKMPTTSERGTNTYYKNEYLKLDYNSIYGGYVIRKVLKGTGEQDFDGSTRKTLKEMISYLRGLIRGLTN